MTEYIICSAIWFNDSKVDYLHQPKNVNEGFVICGRRHHNCFLTRGFIKGVELKDYKEIVQGFLTNTDRFVDRKEAGKIAFDANQIKQQTERLFSEDLY
jgi:hypothetical protein